VSAELRDRVGTGTAQSLEAAAELLKVRLGDWCVIALEKLHKGNPFLLIDPAHLLGALKLLRDEKPFACLSLEVIAAADYPNPASSSENQPPERISSSPEAKAYATKFANGYFALVYVVRSLEHKHQFTLQCWVDRKDPRIASLTELYRAANWYEREIWDLFGVEFLNHPHLERILLPSDWVGHPLKKDYEFPEDYNGMKVPL
jgi:NADH-quinone oxidoreductase subunit C